MPNQTGRIFLPTPKATVAFNGSERIPKGEYALAEFLEIIVGVFNLMDCYKIKTCDNNRTNKWVFNGQEDEEEIKAL